MLIEPWKPKTVKPTTLTPPVTPQIVTITWTNVGILLIRTLETNFKKILSQIQAFQEMHLKMSPRNGGNFVSDSVC